MKILVTGGTGYIGSHTVLVLLEAGHDVAIVDDLRNSKRSVLDRIATLTGQRPELYEVDLLDEGDLDGVFASVEPAAVLHFAGYKAVGESVDVPLRYYRNNLVGAVNLLQTMTAHDCTTLVFSSSCTVYGADPKPPLREDAPTAAANPYGWTKFMVEQILEDVHRGAEHWRIASLRYFNPVGAHPSGMLGEDPLGVPNNLLPFICQVAVGRRSHVEVFGGDYPTADGTCVRDYIHVMDLARGHVAALNVLLERGGHRRWNLGTGRGHSVLEVIAAFERATGQMIPYEVVDRRPGDVPVAFADPTLAHHDLGWRADGTLDTICADAWRWQRANPRGYPD